MKKKLRNWMAAWMCLILVCGMFPLTVFAEEQPEMIESEIVGPEIIEKTVNGQMHEGVTREVLELVNAQRMAAGCKPLMMTAVQEDLAEQRAVEITALFDHDRPDGRSCATVADDVKLTYNAFGENIAAGQANAQEVMDSWMNSEGHKANILNKDYTHIGIGCFEYSGKLYWVQIFTMDPSDTEAAAASGENDIEATVSYQTLCKHEEESRKIETRAATCTESGYKKEVCGLCGHVFSNEILAATGHSFGDWQVTKEATCAEPGEETHTCSGCGAVETREIAIKTEHNLVKEQVTKEATCTEKGSETWGCTVCNYTEEREIAALGHTFGEWTVTKAATWDEEGLRERICVRCPVKETEVLKKLSEGHVHEFTGEVTTTKEATCTQAGEKTIACVNPDCKEVTTEEIPVKGHSFGDWIVTKAATWNTEGTQERSCSVCGDKESAVLPALSTNHKHDYSGTETIVKQATCTEEGSKIIACKTPECDATTTVSLPPTGHYAGEWETAKAATCSQTGKSVQKCSRCDAVVAEKAIAMKDHNYGEWEVVTRATTSAAGEKKRVCKDCGHTEKAVIQKLAAETEKETEKAANEINKNTSQNNVKTSDSIQPLYYVIGVAGAGAVLSLLLYGMMRRKERE